MGTKQRKGDVWGGQEIQNENGKIGNWNCETFRVASSANDAVNWILTNIVRMQFSRHVNSFACAQIRLSVSYIHPIQSCHRQALYLCMICTSICISYKHIVRVSTSNMTFKMACRDYRATLSPLSLAVPPPPLLPRPRGCYAHKHAAHTTLHMGIKPRDIYLSVHISGNLVYNSSIIICS